MGPLKTPDTSVRSTLHLAVFLVLVAGTVVAAYRAYAQEKEVFREEFHKQLSDLTALKIGQILAWQAERKGDAQVAIDSAVMMPELETALGSAPEAQAHVLRWMEGIRQSYKYSSVQLLDPAGNVRLATGPPLADPEFLRTRARETAAAGTLLFQYYPRGAGVLQSHFLACAPLRSRTGALVGSLVLNVDPWLYPFPDVLKWPSATRSGKLFLGRRENGNLRAIGAGTGRSGREPDELVISFSEQTSPFVRAAKVRNGNVDGPDPSGRPVAGVVTLLPGSETTFMVALMDEDEAYQPLRQNQLLLALASGLLIVLCGAGVGWIWRQQVLQSYRQQLDAEKERRALIGHYDYLTRFANDAVFLADGNGFILQANERAADFYGYSRDEMLGMKVQDFRAPGTEADYERAKIQIDKQKSGVFESVAVRKDGSVFPAELSVRVMEIEEAEYRQTIVRDITERRRADEQIDRLNRLYAVLSRCGQAIVKASDESALFQEVVNVAVESGGFCIAAIRVIDPTTRQNSTVARAGGSTGYLDEISMVAPDGVAPGLAGRPIRESGAFVCNDLWQDGGPDRDAARKYNVRSLLSLALWRGGRLAGELRLYSAEPGFFNEEETELATEVAENLCFALESLDRKRKQENVEAELRTNRERLELVLDATDEAYWDWDLESGEILQSPRYDAMLGYGPYEVRRGFQEWLSLVHLEDAGAVNRDFSDFLASGKDVYANEYRMRCKSGEYVWISSRLKVVRRDVGGSAARMVGTMTDVTGRKKLEEQFRQAQKLESVGRLAGGVAHDFNNLLTVINGYSTLLITRTPEGDTRLKHLQEIRKAGERAAELTKQLLTFSRKNVSEPRLLNLNSTAAECETLLRRLTPDHIEFRTVFDARQDEVVIDPGQMQQVLMNLVVNACDAMPAGGRLTVRTANVGLTPDSSVADPELTGRVWVQLDVTDTGVGMDEETLRHIFEPFFTTKEVGKGTGLGLSTVYGIVQQCRGIVRVESSPGAGTTVRIYFPVAAEGILPHGVAQTKTAGGLTGSETVLVVEDQDTVRDYAVNALRGYGYSVIEAGSGADALELAKRRVGPIDLLLTDVIMPSVNGRTVALELRKFRPETKVIYMSGYADGTVGGAVEIEPDAEYLQKPFSPEVLAAKVRRILGRSTVSRTILVVEDEAAVRDLFSEFLGKKHHLSLACDGKEALQILRAGYEPDLVITDLVMPNQEGVELIREIRRIRPATRIIAMSGAFGGRFLKTAELLGADATLVKPIRPEVLEQVIEDVLSR